MMRMMINTSNRRHRCVRMCFCVVPFVFISASRRTPRRQRSKPTRRTHSYRMTFRLVTGRYNQHRPSTVAASDTDVCSFGNGPVSTPAAKEPTVAIGGVPPPPTGIGPSTVAEAGFDCQWSVHFVPSWYLDQVS